MRLLVVLTNYSYCSNAPWPWSPPVRSFSFRILQYCTHERRHTQAAAGPAHHADLCRPASHPSPLDYCWPVLQASQPQLRCALVSCRAQCHSICRCVRARSQVRHLLMTAHCAANGCRHIELRAQPGVSGGRVLQLRCDRRRPARDFARRRIPLFYWLPASEPHWNRAGASCPLNAWHWV